MHQLKQMVEDFTWEPLRKEAIEYAGHLLICDAEFIHKLLGNIWKGNPSGHHVRHHTALGGHNDDDGLVPSSLYSH